MRLVYDEVVATLGDPMRRKPVPPVTKRERGKAWRVTNKVWADICREMGSDGRNGSAEHGVGDGQQPGGVVETSD